MAERTFWTSTDALLAALGKDTDRKPRWLAYPASLGDQLTALLLQTHLNPCPGPGAAQRAPGCVPCTAASLRPCACGGPGEDSPGAAVHRLTAEPVLHG